MIAADGLCGIDGEQRIVLWNDAAEGLLGYKAQEVRGRFCFDVLHGVDDAGCRFCKHKCDAVLAASRVEPIPTLDLKTHTKAGTTIWLAISTVLPPASWVGDVVLVHIYRDISKMKALQRGIEVLVQRTNSLPTANPCTGTAVMASSPGIRAVTQREREVLSLLASGATTLQISETLIVSPATVRNHIKNILTKLHAHSRLEAVAMAMRQRLL